MKRTALFAILCTTPSLLCASPWTYRGTLNDPSSLSGFPRECAGSPFGDRFLVILGLILMDFDLLSSLRYAKRPSLRVARLDGVCAATLRHGGAIAKRRALQPSSLTTHLTRKAQQAVRNLSWTGWSVQLWVCPLLLFFAAAVCANEACAQTACRGAYRQSRRLRQQFCPGKSARAGSQ